MPYITQDRREELDKHIETLQEVLFQGEFDEAERGEGDLNYIISRLVGGVFQNEPRYHTIARITGVLENVKQEFYRRMAGPYEDKAIARSGDIKEYFE